MPAIRHRICLYTRDMDRITGKIECYARLFIEKFRKANDKKKGDVVIMIVLQIYQVEKEQIKQFIIHEKVQCNYLF